MTKTRMAVGCTVQTKIGRVYIAPNGTAFHPHRIGEVQNGVVVSRPELSDGELKELGILEITPLTPAIT